MAGTCLFWGKRICLLAPLPATEVPEGRTCRAWEQHAFCSAQRAGTVPHCSEENNPRQLHFKLVFRAGQFLQLVAGSRNCRDVQHKGEAPRTISRLSSSGGMALCLSNSVTVYLGMWGYRPPPGQGRQARGAGSGLSRSRAARTVCCLRLPSTRRSGTYSVRLAEQPTPTPGLAKQRRQW